MSEGVCGRKKNTAMPKTTVIAPSTKNMNGWMLLVVTEIRDTQNAPSHCILRYGFERGQLRGVHRRRRSEVRHNRTR